MAIRKAEPRRVSPSSSGSSCSSASSFGCCATGRTLPLDHPVTVQDWRAGFRCLLHHTIGHCRCGFPDLRTRPSTTSSAWSPIDSFVGVFLSAGISILLAVIAVNMLLLLVSAWLLAYAGFSSSGSVVRVGLPTWRSNYYKTVLGVAANHDDGAPRWHRKRFLDCPVSTPK